MAPDATLGLDIGSTNLKACLLDAGGEARHAIVAHEGNLARALDDLLGGLGLRDGSAGVRALVTGTEGRRRLRLPDVIAPVALERALGALGLAWGTPTIAPRAVVSLGGEDIAVYLLDGRGRVVATCAGNKCASGTGEFFRQQLARMNLTVDDLDAVAEGAHLLKLSARCSVFMKSDCTHRLNKGEATRGDIALSLSKVMADKVSELLTKARIGEGRVVLAGGATRNRFLVRFLAEAWPRLEVVVPREAPWLEAFGAAHLAREGGAPLPPAAQLFSDRGALPWDAMPALPGAADRVRYLPPVRGAFDPAAEYILGVDGGSTTTKIALVRRDTLEVVASHYGRTHGDPVAALKACAREVLARLGGAQPRIRLAATTGSSRELLGVFLETPGVYNEIIAHTVGTTHFDPAVDTIFEIGGQDAKYVYLNNAVPIDYAMNEACSAGTGSFLEESAQGDLRIEAAPEIGPIACGARSPLKFGEHCSAFINSDIRKAIQQGAAREDIVGGLVYSIVANYLNRVVGNRTVGERIALQGGVAKNPAVPLAFARMTGKPIVVPPDPELMGSFGVALLARRKHEEGLLPEGSFDLAAIAGKEIRSTGTFRCRACENLCEIRQLEVSGRRYPFGGRCSRFTNARKKRRVDAAHATDWIARRTKMLFEEHAPRAETLVRRTPKVVGIPRAFSAHSLWPFYAWFFHALGVATIASEKCAPAGVAKQESSYCLPMELAHGAVQDVLDRGADLVFLPHFRDMPSMDADVPHGCVCPLTQGLPYLARQAFGLPDERILRPVVSFKDGFAASRPAFEEVAERLGLPRADGARAYERALERQRAFWESYRALGREVLREVAANPDRVYVALLGRPYNAFTRDANMGIPRKFVSQGVAVVPFDLIYDPGAASPPNMYWYYGQEDMKAARKVQETPNLYLAWISNFSCAPDSFLLHYVRWLMGRKPYLVLELDSHTADAGLDTRIEAFLDIVESYRRATVPEALAPPPRRFAIEMKGEYCDVVDRRTGERIDVRDPRVRLVWPSMGDLAAEAAVVAAGLHGVHAVSLPVPDARSTQLARDVASGKECIPALLVLGSVLQFFREHPPNRPGEVWLAFVPSTYGPCRTGQYFVFYDRLYRERGWENVLPLVGASENSYREFGPTFDRDIWRTVVLGDYFTDVRTGIKLLAQDVDAGMRVFEEVWKDVLAGFGAGPKALDAALVAAGKRLAAIPKRRTLDDVRKVLIVGEIYVRRDTFSVREIHDYLVEKGIFPKVTGITEWIHYTDYARKFLLAERRKRKGLLAFVRDGGVKEQAWSWVETLWKERVEARVRDRLAPSGFFPGAPHDMDEVIGRGRAVFVEPDMESEATVSPAVAAAALEDGYSGVAVLSPFGCLPGRVIEGVLVPWARSRGYPVIALENDGRPYPPNVLSRMEIFAHNVLRQPDRAAERSGR